MATLTIKGRSMEIEPYVPDLSKPIAIIVDIDGTLAHRTDRSPYDYTRVGEDHLDSTIANLVFDWVGTNVFRHVLIVTGRDHTCSDDTAEWLFRHAVDHDGLFMRPAEAVDRGNKLPDWIIKLNIFNEYIRHQYNVQFVLDDRNQVVEMWRALGLKCLQVEPGDF